MTLDYNYQSTFYGVYSSNKPSQASAYFAPIVDWMPSARAEAQATAKQANLTCRRTRSTTRATSRRGGTNRSTRAST